MLRLNRNTQTKEYSNTIYVIIYEFIISEKNIHYNFFITIELTRIKYKSIINIKRKKVFH